MPSTKKCVILTFNFKLWITLQLFNVIKCNQFKLYLIFLITTFSFRSAQQLTAVHRKRKKTFLQHLVQWRTKKEFLQKRKISKLLFLRNPTPPRQNQCLQSKKKVQWKLSTCKCYTFWSTHSSLKNIFQGNCKLVECNVTKNKQH